MDFAKILETKRLTLSPLGLSDFAFFWSLVGDEEVRKFLGGPVPRCRRIAQFRNFHLGHERVGVWAVRLRSPKTTIGLLILSPHKDGIDYEVSYEFLPAFWGKGLASEATASVVEHGMVDQGLKRVIAETQAANIASCRMLIKQGFTEKQRLERFGAEQIIFKFEN